MSKGVVILGMHRSGTSAVANMLSKMGFFFGEEEELMGAREENPNGFWERHDVMELNDRILEEARASWVKVSGLKAENVFEEVGEKFDDEIEAIVQSLASKGDSWCIKDPRLCLTWPVWKKHLPNSIVLHVYRDPLEVANSLRKRNTIPESFGLGLWGLYNFRASEALETGSYFTVNYNKFLESPIGVWSDLGKFLSENGYQIPIKTISVDDLISRKLYRSRGEGKTSRVVKQIYDGLERGEKIPKSVLNPVMNQLDQFEEIIDSGIRYNEIVSMLSNHDYEPTHLQSLLSEGMKSPARLENIENLTKRVTSLEEQRKTLIDQVQREVDQRDRKVRQLNERIKKLLQRIERQKERIEELRNKQIIVRLKRLFRNS